MRKNYLLVLLTIVTLFSSCSDAKPSPEEMEEVDTEPITEFMLGADLSYVNEMLDCGAEYYDAEGVKEDPYKIFADYGAELIRLRLWHHPEWSGYSDLEDVTLAMQNAKSQGMQVLLDFHYSDDWADPGKQKVPNAWQSVVNNQVILGDSLYNYTMRVLQHLYTEGLVPFMVQVGNEINSEILQDPSQSYNRINWSRNAYLINRGIKAVRDFSAQTGEEIEIVLHIAQPENAIWWFAEASTNGVTDYDWIALSYYPVWSDYKLSSISEVVLNLKNTYDKKVIVVETAYPYTLQNVDDANNILGSDALIDGIPATESGQYNYLQALVEELKDGQALGMIYWEPAWISTGCSTQWGVGSHWDNATLFDQNGMVNEGMNIYKDH